MLRVSINWRRIVCSDEKTFVLRHQQRRCWVKQGDSPRRPTRQHPTSLMVWGGISLMGSTKIVFAPARVDSMVYVGMLKTDLEPLARTLVPGTWSFQQDNARPHTAAATRAWQSHHAFIPPPIEWPPYSPDVSPIENLWSLVQGDVDKANPSTEEQLKSALRRSWKARTFDFLWAYGEVHGVVEDPCGGAGAAQRRRVGLLSR